VKFSKATAVPILLIIVLGAIGFSYAWWTETLVIDDTVNTGELKVKFTDMFGRVPEPKYAGVCVAEVYTAAGKWYPSEGGNPQYLPLTDDTLTMKFRNMFPNASYLVYWLRAKNVGTIPAKIKSVTLQNLNDPGNIKGYVEWKQVYTIKIKRADGGVISIPNSNFDWTPIEQVPGKFESFLQGYVLYPGDMLEFDANEPEEHCFAIRLSPDAPNSAEGYTITFDIVFTWTQFNEP